MILFFVLAIYALGFVVVARLKTHDELNRLSYPPYSAYDYAQAGIWGLMLGVVWPVLVFGGAFAAGAGWLLTRK